MYNKNMDIFGAKILIVEDEPQINRLIELVLLSDGFYNVKKTFDGAEAFELIKSDKPDLILLDVMLLSIDGFSLCKKIKEDEYLKNIQVIMLTAKKMEEDVLEGFESGAIDYISKPFSNKILLARIKAHLENIPLKSLNKTYKDLVLDADKKVVKINNEDIKLTNFEFKILEVFMSNIGIVFSRSKLLVYLRGDDGFEISERAVDVQIVNLRQKLKDYGQYIETVRGIGYKLKELD
jgi:two-component system phosphate regulon response regulator PhoB